MRLIAIRLLAVVGVLAVAGCAKQQLQEGLDGLMGQPESTLFARLGYPDGKQQFGDATVYAWGTSSSESFLMPQTQTTTSWVGMTPVQSTTTSMIPMTINRECSIKVAVRNGYVSTYEFYGNDAGCRRYADKFPKR